MAVAVVAAALPAVGALIQYRLHQRKETRRAASVAAAMRQLELKREHNETNELFRNMLAGFSAIFFVFGRISA